jgi:MerR family mercuric resistance operon transcriptional regulator/MerR family gold-responsive transcriptional activator of gol and ges genes
MATSTQRLLIGQLAKQADVKADTVRFYERALLLPRPERTAAGYRVYDEEALRRLRFIKQAQSLGFTLDEIRRILSLRGQGRETCRCVIAIAEATLTETEEKLRELQNFHDALKKTLARWRRLSGRSGRMAAEFCALIESTARRERAGPLHEPPPQKYLLKC